MAQMVMQQERWLQDIQPDSLKRKCRLKDNGVNNMFKHGFDLAKLRRIEIRI